MRALPLFLAVALTGCWSTAPTVLTPAPPTVRVEPPAPDPQPVLVERQPAEPVPTTPPPVPKRRIAQRSIFEAERVTEWTLENGLTVIYAWDEAATGYAALVTGPSGGVLADGSGVSSASTRLQVSADRLDVVVGQATDVLAELGVAQATVLLHGPLDGEWIEPTVAADLGRLPSSAGAPSPTSPPTGIVVAADWDDLPALHVVAALLARRPGASGVMFDAARGRATLARGAVSLDPATPDEIREARSLAARHSREPEAALATLDALYHLPGPFRPRAPRLRRPRPRRPHRADAARARRRAAGPPGPCLPHRLR